MASKNISIREDLYRRLRELKEKGQSFSDIIEQLLDDGPKGTYSRLMKHYGSWKGLPREVDKTILSVRDQANEDLEQRLKERLRQYQQ